MALFNEAKEEYTSLAQNGSWSQAEVQRAFHAKWAASCYKFAVAHGGLYIKCSQFIASLQNSSEAAGVPKEYVEALRPLTDAVPPRPWAEVATVAEEELNGPIEQFVESIEQVPIAAASLAQVHKAVLKPSKGSEGAASVTAAVKLQYPTLQAQIASDFEVMNMMQTMVAPVGYDFSWLLQDLQKYVTSELDFQTEAKNTQAAAEALQGLAPGVLVPPLVPALCSARTLATEFVTGLTRLDQPAALAAARLSSAACGALVAGCFSELWLVHGLVHGDPHAGNIYARAAPHTGRPQVVLLDHGLYHRLTTADRLRMCQLILAAATPLPSTSTVSRLSKHFAGALGPLFPALISPAFAFSTGMGLRNLRAASEGRLPAGTTLEDVWQTLVAMHNGESDVIGLLHSMGYVRGLLNALDNYPEQRRVHALTRSATQAVCEAKHSFLRAPRLALALRLTDLRVRALFAVLALLRVLLHILDRVAAALLVLTQAVFGKRRVAPHPQ